MLSPVPPHRLWLPSLFLAIALVSPAFGQATLTGTIRADSGRAPLTGAEVVIEAINRRAATDPSGQYLLTGLPAGRHVVLFRLFGYRPIRVQIDLRQNDTTTYDAALVREMVQVLDSVRVTRQPARAGGIGREAFEERRRLGFGRFIDSEELRRNDHRTVASLFRSMQGVNIVRYRECGASQNCQTYEERAATGRGTNSAFRGMAPGDSRANYCWMSVMLDGSWLYQHGSAGKVPDLSRDIRVADLEMVEVYRSSAEIPGIFSGPSSACGVIVLWTKRGG